MSAIARWIFVAGVTAFSLPAMAAVDASLDRDHVAPGDTVQLTLTHDGKADGQPDLGPLQRDFDILGTSSGTSIQFVNGHFSRQSQLVLSLSPKHAGTLKIPPLSWSGETSPALSLVVDASGSMGGSSSGSAGTAAGGRAHVFVTAKPDSTNPYVQSGVVLTVRIFSDQPLYQASLDLPSSDDAVIKALGKDRQTQETRDGRTYDVIERRYLVVPQHRGKITLAGPVLDAQVPSARGNDPFGSDPFFGNMLNGTPLAGMTGGTRPIRLHGDDIVLDVRPPPAAFTGTSWLPARNLALEDSFKPDGGSVHVGEPITRHVRVIAEGVTAASLPDLATQMSLPDGLKAYPDQAKTDTSLQGDTLVASREQDIALIASRPGHYQLPALKLQWWDTATDTQRVAELPAHEIDILPAVGAVPAMPAASQSAPVQAGLPQTSPATAAAIPAPVMATPASSRSDWRWVVLSGALAVLWLGTLALWWWSRRRAQPAAAPASATDDDSFGDAGDARKAFRAACLADDPIAARRQLLAWARAVWKQAAPRGLQALSLRLQDPELDTLLKALDRACYAAETDWRGETLANRLTRLQNKPPSARKTETSPLEDLYA